MTPEEVLEKVMHGLGWEMAHVSTWLKTMKEQRF
jgi:hypothetical protein